MPGWVWDSKKVLSALLGALLSASCTHFSDSMLHSAYAKFFRDAMLDSCAYDMLILLANCREPKSFSMDFVAVACGVGLDVRASLGQASSWRWRA